MKIKSVILVGPALLLASALFAQAPAAPTMAQPEQPMTEKEVISELKKMGPDQLQKDISKRGVAFEMDADIEKSLRKAKATDDVIKTVTAAGPKERANAAKASAVANGEVVLPAAEEADFKALSTELDPDKAIALTDAFVKKYPNSEVLSYVYAFEANAYQGKGDAGKIVEFADKSLALKKDNLMSLLLAAYAIPTPQYLNSHRNDEPDQLNKADADCQEALKAVEALKKQPTETDQAYATRKGIYIANIHADLGMIHLDRAQLGLMGIDKDELAKAVQEYQLAVSATDHPDPSDYYRMGEACRMEGKTDDAIAAFSKASQLGSGPVKQFADQQIAALKKAKDQPPASPKP
jgi:tetratricopeptide (TPR) repeat protein